MIKASASHAITYQTTPTYEGSGQAVHPSIIDMGAGNTWHGYRYWMAMTPYPNSDANYERLSILASADGDTWVVPTGVTNPVVNAKHTDPDIYLEGGTMYMFYRDGTGGVDNGSIFVVSSVDGWETHTDPVMVVDCGPNDALSPAVIQVDGVYEMYSVNISGAHYTVERRTASSLTGTWSAASAVITDLIVGTYEHWHLDVIYTDSMRVAAICADGGNGIILAQSGDGEIWDMAPARLLASVGGAWDAVLYRPTIIRTATGFDMWYSAWNFGTPNIWHIGRTAIIAELYP